MFKHLNNHHSAHIIINFVSMDVFFYIYPYVCSFLTIFFIYKAVVPGLVSV